MTQPRRHILLTGAPGVGKTTLVRRLAEAVAPWDPVGFYTAEIRARGTRTGFRLVSLDGRDLVLAHVQRAGPPRVGRYGVDVPGFDRMLEELDLGRSPAAVVVIDEIGKMECHSARFRGLIVELLESSSLILATIALRGDAFIERIKRDQGVRLVTVTRQNRDALVEALSGEIRRLLGRRS